MTILMLLIFHLSAFASPSETSLSPRPSSSGPVLWKEAQTLSQKQNYEEAIYQLEKEPLPHAAYYFNLGTLYFNKGDKALGLGYLEKASLLDPHDAAIRQQIEQAQEILQIPRSSHLLIDRLSLDEIRGALGLIGFILLISWTRSLLKLNSIRKAFLQPSSLIIVAALLLTLSLYALQRWADRHPLAICLTPTDLKSGPGADYSELSSLRPGERLRILSKQYSNENPSEIWYQIRYSSRQLDKTSRVGWLKKQSLFMISE